MDGYQVVRRIAEGRFGTVSEALQLATGDRVAVKKVRARRPMAYLGFDPWSRSAEREIQVLSRVQHPHVVILLEHFVTAATTLLVYQYLSWDLATVLERQVPMEEGLAKAALRMLLLGVAHLHSLGIIHRDLKPANLLVEGVTGTLKIADFGSSRIMGQEATAQSALHDGEHNDVTDAQASTGEMTRDVCTRWFKSPEMLFGSVDYTEAVDLWSVGCIFAELLSPAGAAAFPGGADLEQLCLIFQVTGTPREEEWPEARLLPDFGKVEFAPRDGSSFDFESARSPQAIALMRSFLRLNPAQRSSAADALEHACFAAEPAPAAPCRLVQGLDEVPRPPADEGPLTPMGESPCGSEDSFAAFNAGAGEFERLDIETTGCGLWEEEAFPLAEEPLPGDGPPRQRTPSPPTNAGEHRFRAGRSPAEAAPSQARQRTPSPVGGVHRLKAGR